MKVLLTNDDGFGSAGITLLYEIVSELKFVSEIWIAAPSVDMSGCSRSLSLRKPIQVNCLGERKYTVDGTPAECVILALNRIMDKKPDLILSGINHGLNVGNDVSYSGTIAAAMEGATSLIPSIALSQAYSSDRSKIKWESAKSFAPNIIGKLIEVGWPKNAVINVNFPAEKVLGIKFIEQGQYKMDSNASCIESIGDNNSYVIRGDRVLIGSGDVDMVSKGFITITALKLDFTDYDGLKSIESAFKKAQI
ncbi:MAG: 5'-nucleotidase SurE [Candidatus Mesenet longicola]|uniref:5'-nucleotidase SurE n=1 Tax=Candidatus Mesenet longicola TaxID=1892558 RepID=A0A8J3MME0_9RICK|nr:MAG: 5'-nucleotidase SurE [Candidatus Mesenet longicola]GHM59839.1 MAG: 5'-nucleotidase SurE [Candidatus Mesenet longicola]